MRSRRDLRIPVWVLLTAFLVLCTAGEIAAEATKGQPTGLTSPVFSPGMPDTLYGGPQNPGHNGDPNDYDKTIPTTPPVWLWFAGWLMGVGR